MRQELFHHGNRPAQIDLNLASDVFEASSFVVNIDLTHDAGVVDQNVELGKVLGDLFVKSGDRFRIGNVASKGVNCWKGGCGKGLHFPEVDCRVMFGVLRPIGTRRTWLDMRRFRLSKSTIAPGRALMV